MNGKLFTFFGFSIKSGNLAVGQNGIEALKRKIYLLALCASASENTKKTAVKYAEKNRCALIESKDELQNYVGKQNCKIVAVTDAKLAEAIYENIGSDFTILIGRKV